MAYRHSPALSSKSAALASGQIPHPLALHTGLSMDSGIRDPPLSPALGSIGSLRSPRTSKDRKPERFDYDVNEFIMRLQRSKYYGSIGIAEETCILLRTVVTKGRFNTVDEVIDTIREVGRKLVQARPLELVIGNIVRRVLFIIRREYAILQKQERKRRKIEAKNNKRLTNKTATMGAISFFSNNNNNNSNNENAPFPISENQKKLMQLRGYNSSKQILTMNTNKNVANTTQSRVIHGQHGQLARRHNSMQNVHLNKNSNQSHTFPQSEETSPTYDSTTKSITQHSAFDISTNKLTGTDGGDINNVNKKTQGLFPSASKPKLITPKPKAKAKSPFDDKNIGIDISNGLFPENNINNENDRTSQGKIEEQELKHNEEFEEEDDDDDDDDDEFDTNGQNPSLIDMFQNVKDDIAALYDAANLLNHENGGINEISFHSKIKTKFVNEINDLKDEILTVYNGITVYSEEQVHSNETILTYGSSRTVLHFLKKASKNRAFEVFICESAPSLTGQKMALELTKECKYNAKSESGIRSVTVITDASIFAIMSRVNKVIIGTHCVLANGGLLTHCGTHQLAMAAKYHRVPVVVVAGLYKLSPLYAFDQDTFNEQGASQSILRYNEYAKFENVVTIENPTFDYVPPDLVDLLVTNVGGYSPSYMYHLRHEYYNVKDYDL